MIEKKELSAKEIIRQLDKYIIGQNDAKRSVALALRSRWRRMQLSPKMQREVTPKNILMIGPTGVGKTEIARRLADMVSAPFIKVEATKFTEVGYVGRDVESIIRDLANVAANMLRDEMRAEIKEAVREEVEERLLNALVPSSKENPHAGMGELGELDSSAEEPSFSPDGDSPARKRFRAKLRKKELEDKVIEISANTPAVGVEIMGPPGMEEISNQLQSLFKNSRGGKETKRKLKISEARRVLTEEIIDENINEEEIRTLTVRSVEENGIVFLDEVDKITQSGDGRLSAGGISREGVQRDLLPIIEGSSVKTRYGMIKTDHILFVASGAFHLSTPADMIPELQGRLPVRVNLSSLQPNDLERILREPDNSLILQYQELLATEGLCLKFSDSAIVSIANIAWQVNENTENIGARRLYTLMEKLLEDISFKAEKLATKHSKDNPLVVDDKMVESRLRGIQQDKDLSKYIL